MKKQMFLGAHPLLFENAKILRNNSTNAEIKLWGYLRTKPLGYKFRRQHPIGVFIADFYCHSLKLIIEVDGGIHLKPEVKWYDEQRQQSLEFDGIAVIRFTNEEVLKQYEATIEQISSLLEKSGNSKSSGCSKFPLQGAEGVL
jgi:cyclase